jgi:hypothetical protein
MKINLKTKFHRDGSVTLWSVHRQQWVRIYAADVSVETLATMTDAERTRLRRVANR